MPRPVTAARRSGCIRSIMAFAATNYLWVGEAEFGRPFNKDGDIVPDGTVVEQFVFFGNDIFNDGTFSVGEAGSKAVDDCHEGPDFGFICHSQSVDPTAQAVNRHRVPILLSQTQRPPRGWLQVR